MTDRYNPQHGANMVDRYIGSAFDIVYGVYKQLGNMPVFLEFVNETSPRMEQQYADIIGRFDHIVGLEASALNSKEVAEQAAADAIEYKDTTQQLIDEAEEFKQFVINVVENTIQDIEDRFAEFIVASGYEFIGNYGIGIEVTEYNQLLRDVDGEFWRLSGQRSIPYITTGAGLPEDDAFIPVGDASLRQDLDDPIHGSKIVQYDESNSVYDAINRNREDFWANKETMGGIYTHYVREDDGTPVAGAECAVYIGKTGVLATDLKDKFGETLANPFVTTADGLVQFVADPGMYTLQVSFDLVVHTYSVYFADDGLRNNLADSSEGANLIGYGESNVHNALEDLEQFNADLANPDKGAAMVAYNPPREADASTSVGEFLDNLNSIVLTPDPGDACFTQIASLARSGQLRLAVVGDSTAAGVGTGGGAYGECNPDELAGYAMFWYWALINSDPAFVGADSSSIYYRRSQIIDGGSLPAAFPAYNLVYADSPVTPRQELVYPHGTVAADKLTIYYAERTSNGAALFDVVVSDPVTSGEIARYTIDTYVDPVDFGSAGVFNVNPRLTKLTMTLPQALNRALVHVENVALADRGAGMPANGTANVYGFALGEGVFVRNYAVSSTTLLNDSAANILRGVTTTERLQKCYDMNANAVVINWGTNDSKPGVSSLSAFRTELTARIDEIREYQPDIAIVLVTAPQGSGPEYENNVEFFDVIREVSVEKNCALLDGERILRQLPRATVVADDVHPNQRGYKVIADALASRTSARSPQPAQPKQSAKQSKTGYVSKDGSPTTVADFTGDWVLLEDIPIGRMVVPSQLYVRAAINLFRAGAAIEGCELAVSFGASPGGVIGANPTTLVHVPRVPADTGDARGTIADERVLYSAQGFTSGQYYLKVWAKNFMLRPTNDALRVLWRFEEVGA